MSKRRKEKIKAKKLKRESIYIQKRPSDQTPKKDFDFGPIVWMKTTPRKKGDRK